LLIHIVQETGVKFRSKVQTMIFGRKSRARVCPYCQRDKKTAISEQLAAGEPCGPDECKFKADILAVLKIVEFHPAKQSGEPGTDLDSILEKLEVSTDSTEETRRRRETASQENNYVEDELGRKYRRKKKLKRILTILIFLVLLSTIVWYITKSGSEHNSDQSSRTVVKTNAQVKNQKSQTVPVITTPNTEQVKLPQTTKDELDTSSYIPYQKDDPTATKIIGRWKGKFLNDSMSLIISGVALMKIYGFVKRNNRSIQVYGWIRNPDDTWTVSLLEPGTDPQDGTYDLSWNPDLDVISGEWVSYNRRYRSEIQLQRIER